MPDAVTSTFDAADADLLDDLCRELAEAADAVGEAAGYASGLALGARLPAAALTRGGLRRHGWRTLLRTLSDPAGLGWAPRGRGIGARAGRLAGALTGRESLAVSVAVCGLRARIRAAKARRPELLGDPGAAAVLAAAAQGRQAQAVALFRRIVRDRGAEHAFSLLTPAFADILAWHALTDANPFNDHAGWQVATGRAVPAAPLLGLGAALLAFCDRGPGLPAGGAPGAGADGDTAPPEPGPPPRRLRAVQPIGPDPYRHSNRPGSLRGHAAALRSHAVRLRTATAAPAWRVPDDDALRAEVATLACRCATAANGFTLAAAQLGEERLPG
ncbi:hypothetical protein ACTVZO_35310 [Streptomyces sp. IBSNAI002]|uniref:hypothetical protein n=1 Tax=Streptomyces sp. IBSNAI002 TaxID=3457500 RepID=UPI003FD4ABDF